MDIEPNNFTESLKKLISIGRDIITNFDSLYKKSPPYWARCLDLFSNAVNNQLVIYNTNNTPEEERFMNLKKEFKNLYLLNEEEFKSELIYTKDGIKKCNDEWIRIYNTSESSEEKEKEKSIFTGLSYNRGLSIVIHKKLSSKGCDIEYPLSELFEVAILIKKRGFTVPHYPYSIIYGVYKCISFVEPNHHTIMDKIIIDLFPYTKKEDNSMEKNFKKAKKIIKPLIDSNRDILDGFIGNIMSSIDEIDDEQIDNITSEAQKSVLQLEKGTASFSSLLANFIPGDIDPMEKMEELGISTDKITSLINKAENGTMTNEELINSIPTAKNEKK